MRTSRLNFQDVESESLVVITGLAPMIHLLFLCKPSREDRWIAGSSPAMTATRAFTAEREPLCRRAADSLARLPTSP
jgi:hypothetical protein